MAFRVPIQQSQRQLPSTLGTPRATADDFGAGIAQGVADVAGVIRQRQQIIQEKKDRLFAQDFKSRLQSELRESFLQVGQLEADKANNIHRVEESRLGQRKESLLSSLQDKGQSTLANQIIDQEFNTYLNRVASHEASQLRAWESNSTKNALLNQRQNAFTVANGDIENLEGIVGQFATITSDPTEIEKNTRSVYKENMLRFANDDPEGAERFMKQNRDLLIQRLGVDFDNVQDSVRTSLSTKLSRDEKADNEKRRLLKEAQEDIEREFIVKIANDEPVSIVEVNRAFAEKRITDKQRDNIFNELSNPVVIGDEETFAFIDDLLVDDAKSVSHEDIYDTEHLTSAQKKELDRKRVRLVEEEFNNDYKTGVEELEAHILTSSRIQKRVVREEIKLTAAKKELFNRLDGGEDLEKVVSEMIPRYRSVTPSAKELPKTRFVTTPRDLNSVKAAQDALQQKIVGGQITDIQAANRDAEILENLEEIYTQSTLRNQ